MKEAEVISTLLSDNWNSANTDGVTPIIDIITNYKNIDVTRNHFILTYNTTDSSHVFSAMATQDEVFIVSIDLRSQVKGKYYLFIDEIKRIIKANYINPATGYHRLALVREPDLSDRTRGMYRRVIDVMLRKDMVNFNGDC